MTSRCLPAALALAVLLAVSAPADGVLDIYFIDTEGGQATLLVSPSGETFLIETGFAGLDTPNPDKVHSASTIRERR